MNAPSRSLHRLQHGRPRRAGVAAWAWRVLAAWLAYALLGGTVSPARAQQVLAPGAVRQAAPSVATAEMGAFQQELDTLIRDQTCQAGQTGQKEAAARPRVEVVLGTLDPRLKLAPCEKVHAYLPDGTRLWGRSRVGLRCERGAVRWNVYWPVTVKVWAPAVVAVAPLRPGEPIQAADLRVAEVDLAAAFSPAILQVQDVVGRSVVRAVEPGQALRQDDIRQRRWFAAGDPVSVMLRGKGFAVGAAGTALSHGDEGRCVKIRVESGRILCGQPVGDRRVEVTL